MLLIIIDNYDSFTYNLVQLFYKFNINILVFRNDEIDTKTILKIAPNWICISPGPGAPIQAGNSLKIVKYFAQKIPILGVCLGMQIINEAFNGKTHKAPIPIHGKCSKVYHKGQGIFSGITNPFIAARYHSLCVKIKNKIIEPLAFSTDGVIMGLQHKNLPIWGIQFHPESFLTEFGPELASNFLKLNQKYKKSISS